MRIIELELTNFKGERALKLDLNGNDAIIRGDNATGKTTIMDAFIWLLTGKDHMGRSDMYFNIKTLDDAGEAIPMIDHTVRARLEHNGDVFELTRTFKETWVKKTGTNEKTFTGHETEYFKNGISKGMRAYQTFVDSLVSPQLLKLLSMPGYFNEQVKPDERRKMLIDMCGNISDEDILADKKFTELAKLVGKFVSVVELKDQKAKEKSRINEQLKAIPVRIDTHNQYLGIDLNQAKETAASALLSQQITEKTSAKNALYTGEAVSQLRNELSDLQAKRAKAETEATEKYNARKNEIRRRLDLVEDKIAAPMSELARITYQRRPAEETIEKLTKQKDRLLEEYDELYDWDFTADNICPTCGQAMPGGIIDAARAKFNEDKSKRLEAIVVDGKKLAADIDAREVKLEEDRAREVELRAEIKKLESEKKAIEDEIAAIPYAVEFDDTLIPVKRAEVDAFNASVEGREAELDREIESLKTQKEVHDQNLAKLANAENAAKQIEKLKAEEKQLSAAFEECERIIALCDDFSKSKVELLDAKISGAFRFTQFKLTETLINGGTKDICDAMIGGVPYSAANNAARINCGLDIIETFSQAYGITVPIFIDNAESVTRLYPMDTVLDRPQIIQLVVSEPHKKLDLEVL